MESTIAFVGQCHTAGYPGVPPDSTFPRVLRQTLEALRPDARIHVLPCAYFHPAELPDAIDKALRASPRIVVIEVVGWLAVRGGRPVDLSRLPPWIRSPYERVRHFRHASQRIMQKLPPASLVHTVQKSAFKSAARLLAPIIPRRGRASLEEYEYFVADAIRELRSRESVTVVIQGPAAPPDHLTARGIAPDMLERYKSVRAMASRVAETNGALFIDRWDTVSRGSYLDNSIRPRASIHSVWGHLLADELVAAGLV